MTHGAHQWRPIQIHRNFIIPLVLPLTELLLSHVDTLVILHLAKAVHTTTHLLQAVLWAHKPYIIPLLRPLAMLSTTLASQCWIPVKTTTLMAKLTMMMKIMIRGWAWYLSMKKRISSRPSTVSWGWGFLCRETHTHHGDFCETEANYPWSSLFLPQCPMVSRIWSGDNGDQWQQRLPKISCLSL